jgi:hypothetical protein
MPRLGAADADEKIRSLDDAIAVRHVRDNAHGSAGLSVDATDTCSQVHGDPPARNDQHQPRTTLKGAPAATRSTLRVEP